MNIYDGQMIYNSRPRYNISREVLQTKIMPRDSVMTVIDENGAIVAGDETTNWGPLALAAALAYFAMG